MALEPVLLSAVSTPISLPAEDSAQPHSLRVVPYAVRACEYPEYPIGLEFFHQSLRCGRR